MFRVWANARRGHADAHVQRLPCSEVLQRKSQRTDKDICGVLSKWRKVVKDGVSPDSCTAELVAFLQR